MQQREREALRHYPTTALLRDLWGFIQPYRWKFFFATALEFLSNIVWLYPPYALGVFVQVLADGTFATSKPLLLWTGMLWLLLSLVHYIGREIAFYYGFQVAERSAIDAQYRTLSHLLTLDLLWHERENAGNKLKRIQKGGEGIDNLLSRIWFMRFIKILVNFVGMVVIVAFFDITISILLFLYVVSYYALSHMFTVRAGRAAQIVNLAEEDVHGIAFEAINNVRSVKVLGMAAGLLAIVHRRFEDLVGKVRTRIGWFRLRQGVMNVWGQMFRLGLTFYVIWGILQGNYDVGFLVVFYNYFNYIWESIEQFSMAALDFIIAKYGVFRMVDILKQPMGIDDEHGKRAVPHGWKKICIRNLSFSYGKKEVLSNIDLVIRRGERIGIVGVSGGGKSTLFKLLLKEHEDYEGEIFVDDVPLREIRRSSFFRHAAVVLQDTEVFNFTIRDNVTLGNSEQIENAKLLTQAISIAHVSDFLDRMPDGIETYIGEKGIKLSGGEKQRLGIARAIFKRPEILFLDEATSHLDSESEGAIRDSLHQFFQDVTAVVIAHRLSTIREMDRIVVLENGKIIEQGTFDELHAKKGRFRELWEKQKF